MDSLDELMLELGVGIGRDNSQVGGTDWGWGFLVPSQMFFHLKPKAMVMKTKMLKEQRLLLMLLLQSNVEDLLLVPKFKERIWWKTRWKTR